MCIILYALGYNNFGFPVFWLVYGFNIVLLLALNLALLSLRNVGMLERFGP